MPSKRLVLVAIDLQWPVPHHHHVFAGIQRFARECGDWHCVNNPSDDWFRRGKHSAPPCEGIVGRITPELAAFARRLGIPLVNVWRSSPVKNIPFVTPDYQEAGRMAAAHLLRRGFRQFGLIGHNTDQAAQLQLAGFRSTLADAGHDCSVQSISRRTMESPHRRSEFQIHLGRWMDGWKPPIGIFAQHDLMCRYVCEACIERGLRIPYEVGLIGANNSPLIVHGTPTLSSIEFGFERVGYDAGSLLNDLMNGALAPAQPLLLPPVELIARDSTNAFAVNEPVVAEAMRFIADHLHEDIDVLSVAEGVSTARRTLERVFKKSSGFSVYEIIMRMRIDRAKHELIHSHLPIKTVAARCGFRDITHLGKAFQRIESVSPSAYREARTLRQDVIPFW